MDTKGLSAGYNLHFDLFTTTVNKEGDTKVGSNAPFSHDASTAYNSSSYEVTTADIASVPEPSTLIMFGLAIAGLFFSRKLLRPPVQEEAKK